MNDLLHVQVAFWIALAAFFAAVYMAQTLGHWLKLTQHKTSAVKDEDPLLKSKTSIHPVVRYGALRIRRFIPQGMRFTLSQKIVQAGGLKGMTPAQICFYSLVLTLIALTLGLVLSVKGDLPLVWSMLFTLGGLLLPFLWLRDQVVKRHHVILRSLPFHLDLLTLCVEAGMDFGAGVARMVEQGKAGPLRDEFTLFLAEMRLGKTRAEALRAMGLRVGLGPLSTFLGALIQADRMGSSLGVALRSQAQQVRSARFHRAEKLAGQAPVKILLPLVLFIFPTLWIILGAPVLYDWIFRGVP
jgi:tight adherence protein C